MGKSWRKISVTIFFALVFLCILLIFFNSANSAPYTGQSVAEKYNISVGESIFNGNSILIQNDPIVVPTVTNLGFLSHQFSVFVI